MLSEASHTAQVFQEEEETWCTTTTASLPGHTSAIFLEV